MEKLIKTEGNMRHLKTLPHPEMVKLVMRESGRGKMRCEIAVQMTEKLSEAVKYAKTENCKFIN